MSVHIIMGNVFILDVVYYSAELKLAVVQMRTPIAKVFTCTKHFHMYIIRGVPRPYFGGFTEWMRA